MHLTVEEIYVIPTNRFDCATGIVREYIDEHLDKSDPPVSYDVYVAWFCYIFGGEVTFNVSRNEIYLDAYKKFENRCYPQSTDGN
jgi:hypothetical protein